jgi:hypothetical protein
MTHPGDAESVLAEAEAALEAAETAPDRDRVELLDDLYATLERELEAGQAPPAGR